VDDEDGDNALYKACKEVGLYEEDNDLLPLMILSSVADLSQADEVTKKKLVKLARDDPAQAAKHVK